MKTKQELIQEIGNSPSSIFSQQDVLRIIGELKLSPDEIFDKLTPDEKQEFREQFLEEELEKVKYIFEDILDYTQGFHTDITDAIELDIKSRGGENIIQINYMGDLHNDIKNMIKDRYPGLI